MLIEEARTLITATIACLAYRPMPKRSAQITIFGDGDVLLPPHNAYIQIFDDAAPRKEFAVSECEI